MCELARTPYPRLRAALARQAERTTQAAELVRAGAELDEDARRRLADLLDLAGQAAVREGLNVHVNDRLGGLTDAILRAQEPRGVGQQTGHGWAR